MRYRNFAPKKRGPTAAGITAVVSAIFMLIVWGTIGVWYILMDRSCLGHLKRAADSNTVELAQKELEVAIGYIEQNNLDYGYTSIFYNTPDEDMEFWAENLKQSKQEIDEVIAMDPPATPLEKSNVLMKLRETLLDHGQHGEGLTYPDGLTRYPHNGMLLFIQALIAVLFCCAVYGKLTERD